MAAASRAVPDPRPSIWSPLSATNRSMSVIRAARTVNSTPSLVPRSEGADSMQTTPTGVDRGPLVPQIAGGASGVRSHNRPDCGTRCCNRCAEPYHTTSLRRQPARRPNRSRFPPPRTSPAPSPRPFRAECLMQWRGRQSRAEPAVGSGTCVGRPGDRFGRPRTISFEEENA